MIANSESAKTKLLTQFVEFALAQNDRAGLTNILRWLTSTVRAYGSVLWEVAPNSDFKAHIPRGHLFVLDQWLEDERIYAFNDLPAHSAAGFTVLTGKTLNVPDVSTNPYVSRDPRYLQRLGVKTLISVPILFPDSTRRGAITVYRTEQKPFSDEDSETIEQFALLVPALYQTIRVKLIFSLVRRVETLLTRTKSISHAKGLAPEVRTAILSRTLSRVCKVISEAFNCVETSLFLDLDQNQNAFQMIATTWPEPIDKRVYKVGEKRLTSWVITHGKPVRIFDLGNYERDKIAIRRQYRGIGWSDSLDIKASIRRFLKLKQSDDLPPLSFMAVPIAFGGRVLGVIRCCSARGGPYYFADADLNLLELVAGSISQYLSDWQLEMELYQENQTWNELSKQIGQLNAYALAKLDDATSMESDILLEALQITNSVISDAEVMDIRMQDNTSNTLKFSATHGHAWHQGSRKEITARRETVFPIGISDYESAGEYVFRTGKVYSIPDVRNDPYYSEAVVFPNVKRMIIAPVKVGSYTYGVLDIRGINERPFPANALSIAELLGCQLGLYHYIAETIELRKRAEASLAAQVKERIQTLEDLAHQLKSPLNQAQARIEAIVQDTNTTDRQLLAVRGLTRKSKRVAMSTMIFASLAADKEIQPKLRLLDRDTAVRLLIEAASDNQLMIDPSRNIRMQVDRESFDQLDRTEVKVDFDLLEQALNNILDNAGKYSYKNTRIEIFCGLTTRSGRFHITVINSGLSLKAEHIADSMTRGWRSDEAKLVTGEGSGIGLWLVKNIMDVHGGELRIIPSNDAGRTEIKLIFPIKPVS